MFWKTALVGGAIVAVFLWFVYTFGFETVGTIYLGLALTAFFVFAILLSVSMINEGAPDGREFLTTLTAMFLSAMFWPFIIYTYLQTMWADRKAKR